MDSKTKEILTEIKDKVKQIMGDQLISIILYGSYARNEQDDDSDMDVVILTKADDETLERYDLQLNDVMFDLFLKYNIVITILLKNFYQFNKYVETVPLYKNIKTEGIEIYGRKFN